MTQEERLALLKWVFERYAQELRPGVMILVALNRVRVSWAKTGASHGDGGGVVSDDWAPAWTRSARPVRLAPPAYSSA